MRMRARTAATAMAPMRAATLPVSAARVVRLAVVALRRAAVFRDVAAVDPGQHSGEEEEDAVHDAEREAGLEHRARLVGVDVEPRAVELAEDAKVDVVAVAAHDVGAVGVRDEAEVVDACDERADEACE